MHVAPCSMSTTKTMYRSHLHNCEYRLTLHLHIPIQHGEKSEAFKGSHQRPNCDFSTDVKVFHSMQGILGLLNIVKRKAHFSLLQGLF